MNSFLRKVLQLSVESYIVSEHGLDEVFKESILEALKDVQGEVESGTIFEFIAKDFPKEVQGELYRRYHETLCALNMRQRIVMRGSLIGLRVAQSSVG